MLKKELLLEENKYIEQYHKSIFKLMDKSDISNYEYPLINLVHQTIENELKYLIAESNYNEQTYKDLNIHNTHCLDDLLLRDELKKYYEGIEDFERIFGEFKEKVHYFGNVLGKNTFLNSRYAIETKINKRTYKKTINYDEFYENWARYSELYRYMMFLYVSYSYSNSIIYFRNQKMSEEELNLLQLTMVKKLGTELNKIEQVLIYTWIDKFVKRNKYYDEKYVN